MKVLLASLLALTPVSASAEYVDSRSGYAHTQKCYRSEYREEYIPGTKKDPGYVRTFSELLEVPCQDDYADSDPIIKRETVVVLPFVPVIQIFFVLEWFPANSISLITGIFSEIILFIITTKYTSPFTIKLPNRYKNLICNFFACIITCI